MVGWLRIRFGVDLAAQAATANLIVKVCCVRGKRVETRPVKVGEDWKEKEKDEKTE